MGAKYMIKKQCTTQDIVQDIKKTGFHTILCCIMKQCHELTYEIIRNLKDIPKKREESKAAFNRVTMSTKKKGALFFCQRNKTASKKVYVIII